MAHTYTFRQAHTTQTIYTHSLTHMLPIGTDLSTPRSIHMCLGKVLHFAKSFHPFVKWATSSRLDELWQNPNRMAIPKESKPWINYGSFPQPSFPREIRDMHFLSMWKLSPGDYTGYCHWMPWMEFPTLSRGKNLRRLLSRVARKGPGAGKIKAWVVQTLRASDLRPIPLSLPPTPRPFILLYFGCEPNL